MTSTTSTAGRRVLITGAGSGIGQATAVRLARAGARVALLGRTRGTLERTASMCREAGAEDAQVLVADVTDPHAVDVAMGRVAAAWGALDGLVNNAGIVSYAALDEISIAAWNEMLAVNLTGPFLVSRAALPWLRKGDRAAVVMVASTLGLVGLRHASAYCAAKAGLVNFARALALELAAEGIRVNTVCPGVTETPMLDSERDAKGGREALLARLAALHPVGRLGQPDEIAAVIEILLDGRSSFVTGAVIPVDGGQTAGFLE